MRRRTVLSLVLAPVVVVALVVLAVVAIRAGGSDDGDGGAFPPVEGTEAPDAYRIVYRVTTPDSTSLEEHVVRRPFLAHVVQRSNGGQVTAERWSDLGVLVTRSQGAPAVAITTAIAPAASDLRPDHLADRLVAAGRLEVHEERIDVHGRTCRLMDEAGEAATAEPGPVDAGNLGSVPLLVSRCVDDQGLVLEERWTTVDGTRVLTKRAEELQLGDDVPEIVLPDAEALPDSQGNGAIEEVDAAEPPPFLERFELPAPEGFTFVGRYAVVPARVSTSADPAALDVGLALYTDVWRRGPDLLLLDQGATTGAPAPFPPDTRIGETDLGELGTAEVASDLRSAEVRLTRADHGFVRLAGTIPPTELVLLARTLQVLQEAPR